MDITHVEIFEDTSGVFHYQVYTPGVKNARRAPTLCDLDSASLRRAAWFAVGDRRGRVHYDRGCAQCRDRLTV